MHKIGSGPMIWLGHSSQMEHFLMEGKEEFPFALWSHKGKSSCTHSSGTLPTDNPTLVTHLFLSQNKAFQYFHHIGS